MTTASRGMLIAMLLSVSFPLTGWSQGTEISAGASGLISVQPIDDSYVGGPYLSDGVGGFGPGFGATLTVVTRSGFIAAAEFSTAWFEEQQGGRLVGGTVTTTLNDAMLGGLAGYAGRHGSTQVHVLGGLYWLLRIGTTSGRPLERRAMDGDMLLPFSIGGGLDVVHAFTPKVAFVVGGRYTYVERENLQFRGIGPHIIRAGLGVRVRLK